MSVLPPYSGNDPNLQFLFTSVDEKLSELYSLHGEIAPRLDTAAANSILGLYTRDVSKSVSLRGIAISDNSGNFVTTSGTFVDVPNSTIKIEVSSRPVFLMAIPRQLVNGTSYFQCFSNGGAGTDAGMEIKIFCTTTAKSIAVVSLDEFSPSDNITVPPGCVSGIDTGPLKSIYEYKLQVAASSFIAPVHGSTAVAYYVGLMAFEL